MRTGKKPDSQLLQRAAGCLAGVAVGDALGGPLEGYDTEPAGRQPAQPRDKAGRDFKSIAPGDTSDDTALTRVVAESIVARRKLDPADLAARLAYWFHHDGLGIGSHTENVLTRISRGEDWEQAALEVQAEQPDSAGNGSLMRCAPVGLFRFRVQEMLVEDSRLSSRVTHPHSYCQWSCVFVNLMIAELLAGNIVPGAFASVMDFCSSRDDFPEEILERAHRATRTHNSNDLNPTGFVLDSFECSLWALLRHRNFAQSLSAAVSLGGDADTIGAITGALAGAAYGLHAIPGRWLVQVSGWLKLQDIAIEIITFS